MSPARHLKPKTEVPTGVAREMIAAIDGGITSAKLLAEKLCIPIQSVSRWAKRLQKTGWLRKDGKNYALTPKAKKLTPKTESSVAFEAALVKDSQAYDPQVESHDQTLKNSEFRPDRKQASKESEPQSFRIPTDAKSRRKAQEEPLYFSTDDWRDFLDLATLPRKAGCSPEDLPRIVYKEAADNGCDAGTLILAKDWTDPNGNRGICIKDAGHGLDPEQVPTIYSPNRPQLSSKRIRRVLRGILGNGCRVIGGAVAASGGTLIVETRGRRLTLQMDMATGEMLVANNEPIPIEPGLTLYLALGPALALRKGDLDLAKATIQISRHAARLYSGPSSPWWYGTHDLYRLAQEAQGNISLSQLCKKCGFAIAGITQPSWRRPAKDFTFAEIQEVLASLRSRNKPVPPKKLGILGPLPFLPSAYTKVMGVANLDGAEPPYVLEVYAQCACQQKASGEVTIELLVNGSKTPTKLHGYWSAGNLVIRGCDLQHYVSDPPQTGHYSLALSVITPRLPLTNEGKEPSLIHLVRPVLDAVYKAAKKAYKAIERPKKITIKKAAWQIMEEAYLNASDNGDNERLPANARQVMYAARPYILKTTGLESFGSNYFTQTLLPEYLEAHPEQTQNWDVVFDARGNATEPHTGRRTPLGTLAVRRYLEQIRKGAVLAEVIDLALLGLFPTIGPAHRFKNALFIEKEGFDQLLAATRIAQKYDLFIMSTKGMRVIALEILLDALYRHGLERVFVLHDFDVSGFSIFGTLGKSSRRYQYQNQIQIVDLGLRLADVRAEQLQTEPIELDKDLHKRVKTWAARAQTLARHGARPEEIEFLRTQRSELNMLPGRAFIAFLERKLAQHGVTKVIPDPETLALQARRYYECTLAKELLDRHRDELKAKAAAMPIPPDLDLALEALLADQPELAWDMGVVEILKTPHER
jgi:hypothetical protein